MDVSWDFNGIQLGDLGFNWVFLMGFRGILCNGMYDGYPVIL